mmetsp:Transcript_53563/g.125677  ORF Transcript_53563/g.125677 Transcript_53563/m.125677 type:complete len:266 (+) Transcript_53563:470-1267(+)
MKDVIGEPADERLAQGPQGPFDNSVQRKDVAVGLLGDDVAEHLVVHHHAPRNHGAGHHENHGKDYGGTGALVVQAAEAKKDRGEERQGQENGHLCKSWWAVIREAPRDDVQKHTSYNPRQGPSDVKAGDDGSSLRMLETVQLQPHGEIAEGKPRRSAKDSLADDDDEGWEADDVPKLRRLFTNDGHHAPRVLLAVVTNQKHAKSAHNCTENSHDQQSKLPSCDRHNLIGRDAGGQSREGCLPHISGKLQEAEGFATAMGFALVSD